MSKNRSSRLASVGLALLFSAGALHADPTATLQPGDGSPDQIFDTIQEAVNAAIDGDTILLSTDTFTGPMNRNVLITKNLTIRGTAARQQTVIDCEGQGRAFYVVGANVNAAVFSNMTITNGFVAGVNGRGGGMLVEDASPTLNLVAFRNCYADNGGGFAQDKGEVSVIDCLFRDNSAQSAGGIFTTLADGIVSGCIIANNSSDVVGGGVAISGTGPNGVNFEDCEIIDNTTGLQGGGVYVELVVRATVERCLIARNHSDSNAGGVSMVGDPFLPSFDVVLIKNTIMAQNTAVGSGGGMRLASLAGVFQNVTLADNTAGVTGGGVDATASDGYLFTNSIVWGNRSSDPDLLTQQVAQAAVGLPLVDFSNVEGMTPFLGNISETPMFRNPGQDYHIMYNSPCRDAGDPVFDPLLGPSDIDNQNRVFGGRIDIGADEYAFDEVILLKPTSAQQL